MIYGAWVDGASLGWIALGLVALAGVLAALVWLSGRRPRSDRMKGEPA
jgi:hypothetical protein